MNIEMDRTCATPDEEAMGINVAKPYEEGFWIGKSSKFALDRSPAALAACGGHSQKIEYLGSFPEGSPVCANAAEVFAVEPGAANIPGFFGGTFLTVDDAAHSHCDDLHLRDLSGNLASCINIAWAAVGSTSPILNACTEAGSLRAGFKDLRTIKPMPIVWQNLINVAIVGGTELRKTSVGPGNAGAAGNTLLTAGDGFMEFTVKDVGPERVAGFATYALPDVDPTPADISFGIFVRQNGSYDVWESGVVKLTVPRFQANDRFRVAVMGGVVQYFINGQLFYTSNVAPTFPMHVSVSLTELGASLTNVTTSF